MRSLAFNGKKSRRSACCMQSENKIIMFILQARDVHKKGRCALNKIIGRVTRVKAEGVKVGFILKTEENFHLLMAVWNS